MFSTRKLVLLVAAATRLANAAPAPALDLESHAAAVAACDMVRDSPDLSLAFAGTLQYDNDMSHWSNASSLPSMCSVQPDSPQDIQRLLEIVKTTRTPWAVKGKGHCNNNNMSSTNGLQIAMSEFSQIELSADKKSVKIGTGLDWGQVYGALEPHGLVVVGGRSPSVGVAGLLLSSGYAWITNEYGFAIDNILSADIVLPNGTFTTVSETQDPEIFYALQGGTNNFGIVTSFTLRTFPVGKVWGGTILYAADQLEAMIDATVEYSAKPSNPKATLATQFFATNGSTTGAAIMFYNGENPPAGLFDSFINVPGVSGEAKTHDTFLSSLQPVRSTVTLTTGMRQRCFPQSLLITSLYSSARLLQSTRSRLPQQSKSIKLVTGNIEHSVNKLTRFNRGSAWPHDPSAPYNTFNGLFMWSDPADDEIARALTEEYHNKITRRPSRLVCRSDRVSQRYTTLPNYSMGITPSSMIYGPNMPWLQEVRSRVDPENLVSLTGASSSSALPVIRFVFALPSPIFSSSYPGISIDIM
ncbi:hypothetical protein BKA70DRAFT_1193475 [Coprinopsis sp. MPI-PUGE-AT-0042]|nr:hypothetical protein BKA70DRAFT_1193475 [Coprinopsis sp. MPI-PUGE-AT-0042]